MKAVLPEPKSGAAHDPFLEQPERVVEIAIKAFARAKDAAIRENDRLDIPSYGPDGDGKVTVRHPPRPS